MSNSSTPTPSNRSTVALATVDDMRQRIRSKSKLKGRQADDAALAEVRALLGAGPHRRDLLIENLHVLNDHFGALHDAKVTNDALPKDHRKFGKVECLGKFGR